MVGHALFSSDLKICANIYAAYTHIICKCKSEIRINKRKLPNISSAFLVKTFFS